MTKRSVSVMNQSKKKTIYDLLFSIAVYYLQMSINNPLK